ncbi:MAG: HAD-IB family hydrolase [Gudongella sp.]|jgi:HAD superfamily hydrolase (TIGR01490 family)|nr:HAD-IB family hydrolase [Gudongella sp.]
MGNIAAFFDIDGTIFRNSLMIEHFRKLISFEIIDPEVWYTKVKRAYDEWEKRYGDFEEYLEVLAGVYLQELKGVKREHIDYVANHVIETNWDMVYKYSRNQIEWHKKMGHKVFFISGSPDFLVSRMAEKYGATEYRGTIYYVDEDNRFTGKILKMWDSESKKKVIDEIISQYDVDLDRSFAYGDTSGDLSMLRRMGNPVAINPNRELLMEIKSDPQLYSRITIIVERKNVIYKCDPDVEIL